jgi:hypothetical protein
MQVEIHLRPERFKSTLKFSLEDGRERKKNAPLQSGKSFQRFIVWRSEFITLMNNEWTFLASLWLLSGKLKIKKSQRKFKKWGISGGIFWRKFN